jgi:hypothetical protein|tara:strand:+ start:683 stop:982 length:300 start_codon:yes stop_codon:yes gene_type:complete
MKIFGKQISNNYGELISEEDIIVHPQSRNRDPVVIEKLKKVTPFLTILRERGMTYPEIAGILEVLTGMDIDPNRVRNYILKANPPTIHITITDREDDGT